jgi:hypothetical protein
MNDIVYCMFCESPVSIPDAKLANHHPIPNYSNYYTLINGTTLGYLFLSCLLFLKVFSIVTFTVDDKSHD